MELKPHANPKDASGAFFSNHCRRTLVRRRMLDAIDNEEVEGSYLRDECGDAKGGLGAEC